MKVFRLEYPEFVTRHLIAESIMALLDMKCIKEFYPDLKLLTITEFNPTEMLELVYDDGTKINLNAHQWTLLYPKTILLCVESE